MDGVNRCTTDTRIITEAEIDSLPEGVYRLGRIRDHSVWDFAKNEQYVGACDTFVRILSAAHEFPQGVEDVAVRPDGRIVVRVLLPLGW